MSEPKDPVRILIADDHIVVAQALSLFLANEDDFVVTGVAASGQEALRKVIADRPDVLLLDVRMPNMDGIQVLSALNSVERRPLVFVLTSYPEARYLRDTLAFGAAGFLSKETGLRVIPQAIRIAMAGSAVMDSTLIGQYFGKGERGGRLTFPAAQPGKKAQLTRDEHAVALLLARGMSNDEISKVLDLDTRLLKSHLTQLYEKVGVQNRTQAAVWAIRVGLWVST